MLALITAFVTLFASAAAGQCALSVGGGATIQVDGDPDVSPLEFTAELWLLPSASGSVAQDRTAVLKPGSYRIFSRDAGSGQVRIFGAVTLYNPNNNTTREYLVNSAPVARGNWAHVALTFESTSGELRMTVDGVREDTFTGFQGRNVVVVPAQPLSLCWDLNTNAFRWWNGRMDELRIWSVARPDSALSSARFQRLDSAPGLTGAWHFDNDLVDAVGGNNGRAAGAAGSIPHGFADGVVCPGDEFPGTKGDLELLTGVNGPATEIGSKLARPGDALFATVVSPNGTYNGQPLFWYIQGMPSTTVPLNTVYPDVWLDVNQSFAELVSGVPLPAAGLSFSLLDYPAIPGLDVWSQAVIFDPTGPSGFVATNLHRLRQPLPIYVSTTGTPTGTGSANDPIASLTAGYDEAKRVGALDVYVANGVYTNETPLFDAEINVIGGLNPNTWAPSPVRSTIRTDHRGLRVRGIRRPVQISGLSIVAAPGVAPAAWTLNGGPDMASIGLDVRNCTTALEFDDCRFEAGSGATGRDGPDGAATGISGSDGLAGENGSIDPSQTVAPRGGPRGVRGPNDGGRGGDGGWDPNAGTVSSGAWDGDNGQPGVNGGSRGRGGNGSSCGDGSDGTDGSDGPHGTNGANGASSSAPGGFLNFTGDWFPSSSSNGATGTTGGGGGGGGGGGMRCIVSNLWFSGGGGGGGGSGGQAGDAGKAGMEGGASIAVYLFDAQPFFTDCDIVAGPGGTGGSGGNGKRGGAGGAGGGGGRGQGLQSTGSASSGAGGLGGAGGDGGGGGGGGAGHGGPSWCVLRAGISVFHDIGGTNALTPGLGGLGGIGGASGQNGSGNSTAAPNGLPGPAGLVGTLN